MRYLNQVTVNFDSGKRAERVVEAVFERDNGEFWFGPVNEQSEESRRFFWTSQWPILIWVDKRAERVVGAIF